MMRRTRIVVGATVAGVVLAILPSTSTPADAATSRRCETTSHGRVCANLHQPAKSSKLGREARKVNTWKRLPIVAGTRGTYLGYARRNLANGTNVATVRSKVNRRVWQTFRVAPRGGCKPFEFAAARSSSSNVYPEYAPRCEGHRWVLRAGPDIPEDAYGFNCYTDGNRSCGLVTEPDADGCVSFSRDGYTMCPDGRVYLKRGLAHLAELDRR